MLDSKPDLDQHLLVAMLAAVFGGADRDRTGDPLLAKQVLSQLSYGPKLACALPWLAEPELAGAKARLRPAGFGAAAFARCASEGWWAREDLNFRPHAYQARALTN